MEGTHKPGQTFNRIGCSKIGATNKPETVPWMISNDPEK